MTAEKLKNISSLVSKIQRLKLAVDMVENRGCKVQVNIGTNDCYIDITDLVESDIAHQVVDILNGNLIDKQEELNKL